MLPFVTYGHDRRVDDAQPVDAVDAHRRRVDDGPLVGAHAAACTTGAAPSRRRARPSRGSARRSRPPAPGDSSPPSNARERRLAEDVAGAADRLDPLPPVLLGREVVEAQRRVRARVGRDGSSPSRARRSTSARRAPGSRGRRPATSRRSGSRAAGSGTSGSGRRRRRCCGRSRPPRSGSSPPGPPAQTSHCRPIHGRLPPLQRGLHRDRLRAGVLDVDLEVVLEVLADAGQVVDDVTPSASSSAALPTPESWSSCGELIAPPQRITSPRDPDASPVLARPRRRPRACPRRGPA